MFDPFFLIPLIQIKPKREKNSHFFNQFSIKNKHFFKCSKNKNHVEVNEIK
jgi:hypothetical protein